MVSINVESLEDLGPHLKRYVLPLVKDSVQVCMRSFHDDPFNDSWTFGTQLWRNTWNRLKDLAELQGSPVKVPSAGNDYHFSIGNANIHHHRVGGVDLLPKSARAVKALVDEAQYPLFPTYIVPSFHNIIMGILAEPTEGLKEVFIGKLEKDSYSDQYRWAERLTLFKAFTAESEMSESFFVEEEEEAIPILTFEYNTSVSEVETN